MTRNLTQYPITLEEKLSELDRLIDSRTKLEAQWEREGRLPVGDLLLVTLKEIRKDVEALGAYLVNNCDGPAGRAF